VEAPARHPLICHRCEYDLRATDELGVCPECGEPVSESKKMAVVPKRPAWADSDPRWRRRILLGLWIIVCVPLVDVLKTTGVLKLVPAVNLFGPRTGVESMNDMMIAEPWFLFYLPFIVFSMGLALLFTFERGRQVYQLEWTRRMGVFASFIQLFACLCAAATLPVYTAAGISALFMSLPLTNQPQGGEILSSLMWGFVRVGLSSDWTPWIHSMASIVTLGLASIWLYHAIRSSYGKMLATVLVAGLMLTCTAWMAWAGWATAQIVVSDEKAGTMYKLYDNNTPVIAGPTIGEVIANGGTTLATRRPLVHYRDLAVYSNFVVIAVLMTAAQLNAMLKKSRPDTAR
jgi:hypothetical protein